MLSHQTGVEINSPRSEFDANDPVANADQFSLRSGATISLNVVANDSDPDFPGVDPLRIAEYGDPMVDGRVVSGLSLVSTKAGFTFAATDPIFDIGVHTVTFSYTVVDDYGAESAPATVTLTVTGGGPGSSDPGGGSQPGGVVGGVTLCGTVHPDNLNGGDGDDIILGGNSNDTLTGGGGADTITGDNGEDIIRGDAGNDLLFGCNGKDTINGGTGYDTLSGDNGDDALMGDAGNDILLGGLGNDTLTGGAGDDLLTGSLGDDRFVFGANFGHDTILDFDILGNDRIQISTFSNYNDLKAHAHQVGCDVVITTADGYNTLTLKFTSLASLSSSDFIFG